MTYIDLENDLEKDYENNISNNQEEPVTVNREETFDQDNLLEKIVSNEGEAYELYNNYAINKGFSVRRGKKRTNAQNVVTTINFLCSKEGFHGNGDPSETKKVDKLDTRTGCKAMIRFKLMEDKWKVSDFHAEHNHEFAKPEERVCLRSNRNMSDAHKGVIRTMREARIGTTKVYSFIAEEVGGSQNVGFTKRDCYNFVNRDKMTMFEAGDAQSLINMFKRKQSEDPMFFYAVQVDQENRMTNFFWRDGQSRLDYECFGDVVVFDTTYRTNRYNMICAPLVGVNNHWKNVLFGCAFLLDETTASFKWLFETFLESMNNRPPTTIFTDQCQAMANGIKDVFPKTCHRLCLWHISLNATKNIASYLGIPEFKKMFNKCLYGCETVAEFHFTWNKLLVTFNATENSWLKKLYTLREKWCAAFSLDNFSARIQSSQRSESVNSVFTHMSATRMRLIEFVHHYDKQLEATRSSEVEETFRCKNGVPSSAKKSTKLLYHAGTIYSRKIYNLFAQELNFSMAFKMNEVETNEPIHKYELSREDHTIIYVVILNTSDDSITCSCKMFESMGLLCRHALRILNMRNVTKIPQQYILNRWKKDVKSEIGTQEHKALLQQKDKSSIMLRRNNMVRKAYDILSKAAMTEKGSSIAMQKLKEIAEFIENGDKDKKGDGLEDDDEALDNDVELDDGEDESGRLVHETPILDPPCARTKGMSADRYKTCVEKLKKTTSNAGKQKQKTTKDQVSSSKRKYDSERKQKEKTLNDQISSSKKVHSSFYVERNSCSSPSFPFSMNANISNQLYPSMSLTTDNAHECLPLSNQEPYNQSSFNTLYEPTFSFSGMLMTQHLSRSMDVPNQTPATNVSHVHSLGLYPHTSQEVHTMTHEQEQNSQDDHIIYNNQRQS